LNLNFNNLFNIPDEVLELKNKIQNLFLEGNVEESIEENIDVNNIEIVKQNE
jgi:hypothetical protein